MDWVASIMAICELDAVDRRDHTLDGAWPNLPHLGPANFHSAPNVRSIWRSVSANVEPLRA